MNFKVSGVSSCFLTIGTGVVCGDQGIELLWHKRAHCLIV